MKKNQFFEHVKEKLEPYGPLKIRAMFGGYGFYKDDVIFGIIVEGELFFKACPSAAQYFEAAGAKRFTYQGKSKIVNMPYWTVPEEVLEESLALNKWVQMAIDSSNKSKKISSK